MGCIVDMDQKIENMRKRHDQRRGRTAKIDARMSSVQVLDKIIQNVIVKKGFISNEQINFAVNSFTQLSFFNTLSNEELTILARLLVQGSTKQGEYVFNQGDLGNSFFLIQKGEVSVQVEDEKIKTLSAGQAFGQLALILRSKRAAGIKAITHCDFLIMKPLLFKQTLEKLKTKQYKIKRNSIDLVQIFQGLTNKQKLSLSNALKNIVYEKGQKIIQKGELANAFYIINQGRVVVQFPNGAEKYLGPNQYFGETAFISQGRRKFAVVAIDRTLCSIISKQQFQKHSQTKAENVYFYSMKKWALQRSDVFKNLNKSTLNTINFAFETVEAKSGTSVRNDGLVICLQGKINGLKQGLCIEGQTQWKQNSKDYNILNQQQDGFYAYLNTKKLNQIFADIKKRRQSKQTLQKLGGSNKQNKGFIDLTTFQYLKDLGKGQYGAVKLVRDPNFNRLYALKQISKSSIKQQSMERYIEQERNILEKTEFPFIVGFVKACSDINNVYFLMEYIEGVQLFAVIREMQTMSLTIARYFFASLLSAIEHLHSQSIIYRDIKPENSVVDYTGKVFLIDMGTAKLLTKQKSFRTFTVIGTPHYMAPQIFINQGYSCQTDIWSLGVLLYQFLCGKLPFGENQQDTYKVMAMIKKDKISYPKNISGPAQDLLKLLLNKNPKQRLISASFIKIKQSEFFYGFNWQDLIAGRIIPPYIPKAFKDPKRIDTSKIQAVPLIKKLYPKAYEIGNQIGFKQWDMKGLF